MKIRKAEEKDADGILALLVQVLSVHAAIRPDIFVEGRPKYDRSGVIRLIGDHSRRSYVAEEDGKVLGYALCIIKEPQKDGFTLPRRTLYVDDLCVDANARGRHIGTALFEHVKKEAFSLGCSEITLNVWEGNDAAKAFYANMGMKTKKTELELLL